MSDETNDCNCIEHFCCGYEAGIALEQHKLDNPEIRLTYHELNAISAQARDVKFEGNYAVVVYHLPEVQLFNGTRTWQLGLEILTNLCGVHITRIKFQPDNEIATYEFGLVEE